MKSLMQLKTGDQFVVEKTQKIRVLYYRDNRQLQSVEEIYTYDSAEVIKANNASVQIAFNGAPKGHYVTLRFSNNSNVKVKVIGRRKTILAKKTSGKAGK